MKRTEANEPKRHCKPLPFKPTNLDPKWIVQGKMSDAEARAKFSLGQPATMMQNMNVDGTFLTDGKNETNLSQEEDKSSSCSIHTDEGMNFE